MEKFAEPVAVLAYFGVSYAAPTPIHTNEGDSSLVLEREIPVHNFSHFLRFWEIFFPMWNSLCWTGGVAGCHVL